MRKNNKIIAIGAAALAVLLVVFGAVWFANRPATQEGSKTITVEVVHGDGSAKTFTYHTDEEYLGDMLLAEGLVEGTESEEFGLYIDAVDGETADYSADGAYWAVYQGGEYATLGVSALPVADGNSFSLVYTVYTDYTICPGE